jgi:hypothetical protein
MSVEGESRVLGDLGWLVTILALEGPERLSKGYYTIRKHQGLTGVDSGGSLLGVPHRSPPPPDDPLK